MRGGFFVVLAIAISVATAVETTEPSHLLSEAALDATFNKLMDFKDMEDTVTTFKDHDEALLGEAQEQDGGGEDGDVEQVDEADEKAVQDAAAAKAKAEA